MNATFWNSSCFSFVSFNYRFIWKKYYFTIQENIDKYLCNIMQINFHDLLWIIPKRNKPIHVGLFIMLFYMKISLYIEVQVNKGICNSI